MKARLYSVHTYICKNTALVVVNRIRNRPTYVNGVEKSFELKYEKFMEFP